MEENAEPANVGRGVEVDWVAKQTFETEAEKKSFSSKVFLPLLKLDFVQRSFFSLLKLWFSALKWCFLRKSLDCLK